MILYGKDIVHGRMLVNHTCVIYAGKQFQVLVAYCKLVSAFCVLRKGLEHQFILPLHAVGTHAFKGAEVQLHIDLPAAILTVAELPSLQTKVLLS